MIQYFEIFGRFFKRPILFLVYDFNAIDAYKLKIMYLDFIKIHTHSFKN